MKRALITGINGMAGSHMADLLLKKGYQVYGLERRSAAKHRINTKHIEDRINYISGDLTDQASLFRALEISSPDEVYNFAAQSFVGTSFAQPETTANITALGPLRLLEAIRQSPDVDHTSVRFYQAGSSEMFGKVRETPQTESTAFYPRSPYAVSKIYAHWTVKNYREAYDMFNVNGICFNHESERRGYEFVTRKITDGVAKIKLGLADYIELGNLDAERDWGYAPDFVEGIWRMLQQDKPDDYVLATGQRHSVDYILSKAFEAIGVDNYLDYVKFNPKFMRPTEVDYLIGDASKAKRVLGWTPTVPLDEIITRMVNNDIKILS